ncbi:MAG: glutamine synthetase III [Coriobacteriales bacterium]|nr:glutamine synthetase III [Coriobacteriales bacterium]
MGKITEIYGELVFDDRTMRERIPSETYKKLEKTTKNNEPLDIDVANVVAHSMKEWAVEHGATHYTHWFQPLTGITSEKHDSFMMPRKDGGAIESFSGKELVQGEPDASSFPSGGIRATFEARGYTAWDPTSYAFIKDEVLCIPTAFCSYTGEALDKKIPLLRSMQTISDVAGKVVALFGHPDETVHTTLGAEQEFFLIKEEDYEKRKDLRLTGRTLFGAAPSKGQELEEHYFGAIRPTVNAFMKELDDELWKLGIPAKTKHNEVAPCQHELAPFFQVSNVGIDANLLTMEKMKLIASHYGLVCLLHEKPFEWINGSGKHNNWSLEAEGHNLLKPGSNPSENLQFLVFLTAVIAAVDEYQEILRASVASAGNDHRLGANEAPPAIISIFLGDELNEIVTSIIEGKDYVHQGKVAMELGTPVLPKFFRDTTDRNRTSPFAFTGNKFEFRMPGSNQNLSDANTVLNTIVSKSLSDFLDAMEGVSPDEFQTKAMGWVKDTLTAHQRIIFNGDGYSEEWPEEAARRGLANNRSTPEAVRCMVDPKNMELFGRFGVLSEVEVKARYEVKLEAYIKLLNIEALTMLKMARQRLFPAVTGFANEISQTINNINSCGVDGLSVRAEAELLKKLTDGADKMSAAIDKLDAATVKAQQTPADEDGFVYGQAMAYHDEVLPAMDELREATDAMEVIVDKDYWPIPSYNEMLYYC